ASRDDAFRHLHGPRANEYVGREMNVYTRRRRIRCDWCALEAAPRRCDDLVMSGRDDESFEKRVRAFATELSRSVQRAVKSIDLDGIARQIELGGERFRDLADSTGRWISDRLSDPEAHDAANARDFEPETAARTRPVAGPHPLDLPSDEQGRALSALDS